MPLTAKGLTLDFASAEDLVEIRDTITDEDSKRMTCRPIVSRSPDEAVEFCKQQIADESRIIFCIRNSTCELAGRLSLSDYNPRNASIELGYYIIPEHRGKGYMRKSLENVFIVLFREAQINKIYAQTGSFNNESNRLLQSLGFRRDAILREHHEIDGVLLDDYIYSIVSSEYNRLNHE